MSTAIASQNASHLAVDGLLILKWIGFLDVVGVDVASEVADEEADEAMDGEATVDVDQVRGDKAADDDVDEITVDESDETPDDAAVEPILLSKCFSIERADVKLISDSVEYSTPILELGSIQYAGVWMTVGIPLRRTAASI